MTLKTCRETLEADLGVNKGTLKPFKKLLGALIDRVSMECRDCLLQPFLLLFQQCGCSGWVDTLCVMVAC
jgi:hypothetical protein